MLPVKYSQTWSVLTYLASAYPGKQVERLSTGSALTGHSITHSVSVITNMTVIKQNLNLSMQNEHKGRTWYSSQFPTLILHSSDSEVLHY